MYNQHNQDGWNNIITTCNITKYTSKTLNYLYHFSHMGTTALTALSTKMVPTTRIITSKGSTSKIKIIQSNIISTTCSIIIFTTNKWNNNVHLKHWMSCIVIVIRNQHHLPLFCQKLSMKKCHQNDIWTANNRSYYRYFEVNEYVLWFAIMIII